MSVLADERTSIHRIITLTNANGKVVIDPSQTQADQAALSKLYKAVQADFSGKIASDVTVLSVKSINLVDANGKITPSHGMLINANKVIIAREVAGTTVSTVELKASILHEVIHEQDRRNGGQTFTQYSSSLTEISHDMIHAIDQNYVNYLNGNRSSLPYIPNFFAK